MVRTVIGVKDPRLRKVSSPVVKIDKKIKSIIVDLRDTLAIQKDPEGVGLAACQIGKNLRIFLIEYRKVKKVVINPEIIKITRKAKSTKAKKTSGDSLMEGCLSLPNYYAPLKRNPAVKLSYLDETGQKITEVFRDFLAQVVLHEIDHLDGIIFIDRLLEQKLPLFKLTGDKWEEVEL